ncbi:hypothetical protein PI124_g19451 [Phytophthora idaei]|nr:hypothetical protein PI125_g20686 [Phytophthora idaei]KAG3235510.1 hypothetical protein PI124_g19451 [Phytophthora idaei]
MGISATGSRRRWYTDFPLLRQLCTGIPRGDWSYAVRLPSGLSREEYENKVTFATPLPSHK